MKKYTGYCAIDDMCNTLHMYANVSKTPFLLDQASGFTYCLLNALNLTFLCVVIEVPI